MPEIQRRKTLLAVVRESGSILLKHFGRIRQVRQKEHPSSVVCEADLASEKHIIAKIRREYPEDGLIAEESGYVAGSTGYTWVIDPLDGTSNFVAGLPWFGVQIAVLKNAAPALAAMYLPVNDTLYWAEKDRGAFRGQSRLIMPKAVDPKRILCAFGFDASSDRRRMQKNARLLMAVAALVRNTRATNSLMDFCYTLEGGFGACINLNCKIWDIVPISLIMPEAEGSFTDFEGRQIEFEVNEQAPGKVYRVLGTSKGLRRRFVKAIEKVES